MDTGKQTLFRRCLVWAELTYPLLSQPKSTLLIRLPSPSGRIFYMQPYFNPSVWTMIHIDWIGFFQDRQISVNWNHIKKYFNMQPYFKPTISWNDPQSIQFKFITSNEVVVLKKFCLSVLGQKLIENFLIFFFRGGGQGAQFWLESSSLVEIR